jgi:hypothetical protein
MTLVDRSPDLAKLVEEDFDIEVRAENLLVHHVPYLNSAGEIARCVLVSELSTNGERTVEPGSHDIWVVGTVPYDHQGNKIAIVIEENEHDFGDGVLASCRLSGKPHGRMPVDYHEKIKNYVEILGKFARAVDPSASHRDFPARATSEKESVFHYHDAATSRYGLSAINGKLRLPKVAIVGLGGTGSFILDLIAKTPIEEIHLFDDDLLYAHNVFRAPGAASLEEVRASPPKVDYFAEKYGVFRRNLFPHPVRIGLENVDQLREMDFVFLSIDAGPAKKVIVERLVEWGLTFIDCGIGMERVEGSLRGTVRVTTATKDHHDHLDGRISYVDVNADEYDWNIQTAELNMMSAVLAVTRWKKLCGYYVDNVGEFNSTYIVARNKIINSELSA